MAMKMSFIVIMISIIMIIKGTSGFRDNRYLTPNVTYTLDSLLASNRYDKRLRPGFGGAPVTITVNLFIKSMGPVSENEQSFGLDCYFRQQWHDTRLQYQKLPGLEEFSMSWLFLDKVWKPDTYFINGKNSFLHRITVPNKFLRLRYDGYITYSMRLTITARCPMYLRKFPLDAQRCPLVLGSYGYSNKDLIYRWTETKAVSLEHGLELAQFDLVNVTTEKEKTMMRGTLPYSTVEANFWLKRHTGYFMLQVYIPCGLIVTCSWISFWIDPDAVPARVTLGVTTVLSLTTMGFGGRAQLPRVSYWTALDWFVIICFTSVFSVMIEYAIVNFIDKFTKDFKKVILNRRKEKEEKENELKESEDKEILPSPKEEIPKATFSDRSSDLSSVNEQLCRKISVGNAVWLREKSEVILEKARTIGSRFDLSNLDIKLDAIKELPRRLSTTVREFIQMSNSDQTKADSLRRESEENVPKIVVTSWTNGDLIDLETELENVPLDMTLEVDLDDWSDEKVDEEDSISEDKKISFRDLLKILLHPIQFWRDLKILPKENDIIKLLENPELPDKFSKIDINSRKSFPIAFFISLIIYLVAFTYYLTDDFPERDSDLVLYKQ